MKLVLRSVMKLISILCSSPGKQVAWVDLKNSEGQKLASEQ